MCRAWPETPKTFFSRHISNYMNRPVCSVVPEKRFFQKQARNLKFRILGEEELYYPCSENKGAKRTILTLNILTFSPYIKFLNTLRLFHGSHGLNISMNIW